MCALKPEGGEEWRRIEPLAAPPQGRRRSGRFKSHEDRRNAFRITHRGAKFTPVANLGVAMLAQAMWCKFLSVPPGEALRIAHT